MLQDGTVTSVPQLSVAAGAASIVKRLVHDCVEACPPHAVVV